MLTLVDENKEARMAAVLQAVRSIVELIVMAVRDEDASGLKHFVRGQRER